MTNEDKLKAMIDYASNFAERQIKEHGQIAGMYHVVVEGKDDVIVLASQLGETKDQVAWAIRTLLAELKAARYLYMDEAWMLMGRAKNDVDMDKINREGVEAQPGRVEAVIFQAEDHERQMTGHRVISRDAEGKPSLGPLVVFPANRAEGRMVGLMPRQEGMVH